MLQSAAACKQGCYVMGCILHMPKARQLPERGNTLCFKHRWVEQCLMLMFLWEMTVGWLMPGSNAVWAGGPVHGGRRIMAPPQESEHNRSDRCTALLRPTSTA